MEKKQFQYIRRLIIALAVSGCANILLLFFWLQALFKELPPALYCQQKPVQAEDVHIDKSNAMHLLALQPLPSSQLIAKLSSHLPAENGYLERDLALAALVAFHSFDLPRALLGLPPPTQSRSIACGQDKNGAPLTVKLYPQLSHVQFEAICQFAKTERWPYHAEGLFLCIKANQGSLDPSLFDAFVLTPQFLAIEALFSRTPTEKMLLVNLMLDGSWQEIEQWTLSTAPIAERRQQMLQTYLKRGSATAADLLLKTDFSFALRQLENAQILQILQLVSEKSVQAIAFAKALLNCPRNDAIWNKAKECLQQFGVDAPPLLPPHRLPAVTILSPSKRDRLYIIQEGDNLWKLSRRFGVSIELLRGHNQLKTEVLQPGFAMRIPLE